MSFLARYVPAWRNKRREELIKAQDCIDILLKQQEVRSNIERPSLVRHDAYGFDHITVLERGLSTIRHPVSPETVAGLNSLLHRLDLWEPVDSKIPMFMGKYFGFVLEKESHLLVFRTPDTDSDGIHGRENLGDTIPYLSAMKVVIDEELSKLAPSKPNKQKGSLGL